MQSQLRSETSGGAYADQMAGVLTQLQSVYGTPGATGSLENAFSNLTTALQSLSTTSGSASTQISAARAAQALAQQLNATTQGIQTLRSNMEQDLNISVGQANAAMNQIAQLNSQLQSMRTDDPAAANLMDQRDSAIDQLSQLMDIRVSTNGSNQATIYTSNGVELVGLQASQLTFNSQGTLTAASQWNADPTKSSAGTISCKLANGSSIDMIASNSFKSGQIAADVALRDTVLVQAQTQVDQLAASLASALSDTTTAGAAAPATLTPKAGFDLDVANMLPGNTVNLTYTDTATNTQRQVSIVRVDDPSVLPLSNPTGANPTRIGINFSSGMASVVTQLIAALGGANLEFSNPSGSTLRVVDNGAAAATVNAASVTRTSTSLANGNPQLALFTDGTSLYTGSISSAGSQFTGLAGRITVNAAVLSDPSKLSVYNTSPATQAGDTTRSDFLYNQLTSGTFSYSSATGLGTAASPFKGTLSSYMQQFLSQQSNASTTATQLQQGQDVVVNTLKQKMQSTSAVNIDTEMANLIALQNSYAANAHVMSVVQSMMNSLLQAQA